MALRFQAAVHQEFTPGFPFLDFQGSGLDTRPAIDKVLKIATII
jgi:hypothetical protein